MLFVLSAQGRDSRRMEWFKLSVWGRDRRSLLLLLPSVLFAYRRFVKTTANVGERRGRRSRRIHHFFLLLYSYGFLLVTLAWLRWRHHSGPSHPSADACHGQITTPASVYLHPPCSAGPPFSFFFYVCVFSPENLTFLSKFWFKLHCDQYKDSIKHILSQLVSSCFVTVFSCLATVGFYSPRFVQWNVPLIHQSRALNSRKPRNKEEWLLYLKMSWKTSGSFFLLLSICFLYLGCFMRLYICTKYKPEIIIMEHRLYMFLFSGWTRHQLQSCSLFLPLLVSSLLW